MQVVITGVSNGIGLEWVRQWLHRGDTVLAVARNIKESTELMNLQTQFPGKLDLMEGDVTSPDFAANLASKASTLSSVDVLINNAGVYPEGTTRTDFELGFSVNAISPWAITQALLPALRKSRLPRVIQVSSMMGSIEDNASGGSVAYRASKAALNMMTKTLSVEEPSLITVAVHPGWVKTRMGGPGALITTEESVRGLMRVIEGLSRSDSGKLIDYEGSVLPW